MAKEVKLPQLGQTMEEGTIVSALVAVGDEVSKGDVIFEVETDKATLEVESTAAGFVKKILVEVGATVPVDTPLLILGDKDEVVEGGSAEQFAKEQVKETVAEKPARKEKAAPAAAAKKPAAAAGTNAKVVRLPQLGQTMEEGTIVNALVAEGDEVKKGDVIFEVETDKATLEMESPAAGFVKKILVEVGVTVPVDTPLVILGEKDEVVDQSVIDSLVGGGAAVDQAERVESAAVDEKPMQKAAAAVSEGGRVFASPRAKAVAAELGIDISMVSPAEGEPRIVEADVRAFASSGGAFKSAATALSGGDKIKTNRLQKIVAEKMVQSKREIPCFYLTAKADVTELVKIREKMNKAGGVKVSFNDFIIKAVADGIKAYPILRGQLAGDYIELSETIDIGLAISTELGLVAPLVKDADKKSVVEIAEYCKELIERAKADKLSLEDLEGGCTTVSNLGGFGVDAFIPIVVPGQATILGIGRITDECVPSDGNILIRKKMALTLSVDHKVINGAEAAQFLDYVKKQLEHIS